MSTATITNSSIETNGESDRLTEALKEKPSHPETSSDFDVHLGVNQVLADAIEQLISLRAIPGMVVIRPADANEVVEAYRLILSLKNRPAALICSRQALPILDRTKFASAAGLAKGGYVLSDPSNGKPDVILIGCGSEVSLCVQASEGLAAEGIKTRIVSMPAWELFDDQDQQYQDSVLPSSVTARVMVQEASPIGWDRYAGRDGVVLGMRTFGMSAPMKIVAEHFGFTPEHVVAVAKELLGRRKFASCA
jgi:transketolase